MNYNRIKPIYGIIFLIIFGAGGILGIYFTSTSGNLTDQNPASIKMVQREMKKSGLLQYIENKQLFTVEESSIPITNIFTADTLASQSVNCGMNLASSYFATLLAKFGSTDRAVQYKFTYTGASQDASSWLVTLIPNRPKYQNLTEFTADFSICAAGEDYYPAKVTANNLQFTSSCGTGFSDDSGRPIGCEIVREAIESTMQML